MYRTFLALLWLLVMLNHRPIFAMQFTFTQEAQLTPDYEQKIVHHWQTGVFSSFKGHNEVDIAYGAFIQNENLPCLVISPGRSEGYLKYQELMFDLSQLALNVFIIDHRGQGLSGKMQSNPHKGYVANFDDYANDLSAFVEQIVKPHCKTHEQPLLLAHSMGGAIAIRAMELSPKVFRAALLSSPMIAINSGGIPLWAAKLLIHSGATLNELVSKNAWYFLGQDDYQVPDFENNALMQSPVRFKRFTSLYQQTPNLRLGGVTYQWLSQALTAHKQILADAGKLQAPITIVQAGKDTVVSNDAQNDFCQTAKVCQPSTPIVIDGAQHELFFEADRYRNQALTQVFNWLTDYGVKSKN